MYLLVSEGWEVYIVLRHTVAFWSLKSHSFSSSDNNKEDEGFIVRVMVCYCYDEGWKKIQNLLNICYLSRALSSTDQRFNLFKKTQNAIQSVI